MLVKEEYFVRSIYLGNGRRVFQSVGNRQNIMLLKPFFFFFLLLHNPCFLLATKLRCLFFYPRLKGKAIGLFSLTASNFLNFFFFGQRRPALI